MKEINKAKKLLIVVDMINGFIKEGALADPYINIITPNVVALIEEYLAKSYPIIAFRDCHDANCSEFDNFPAHCVRGTNEVELIAEVKKYQQDMLVLDKNSTSGFVLPEFIRVINKMTALQEVVIVGCCTDICVINLAIPLKNYFNQKNKSIAITVPQNTVETYHIPGKHDRDQYNKMAFALMEQAGVNVPKKLTKGKKINDYFEQIIDRDTKVPKQ